MRTRTQVQVEGRQLASYAVQRALQIKLGDLENRSRCIRMDATLDLEFHKFSRRSRIADVAGAGMLIVILNFKLLNEEAP